MLLLPTYHLHLTSDQSGPSLPCQTSDLARNWPYPGPLPSAVQVIFLRAPLIELLGPNNDWLDFTVAVSLRGGRWGTNCLFVHNLLNLIESSSLLSNTTPKLYPTLILNTTPKYGSNKEIKETHRLPPTHPGDSYSKHSPNGLSI